MTHPSCALPRSSTAAVSPFRTLPVPIYCDDASMSAMWDAVAAFEDPVQFPIRAVRYTLQSAQSAHKGWELQ